MRLITPFYLGITLAFLLWAVSNWSEDFSTEYQLQRNDADKALVNVKVHQPLTKEYQDVLLNLYAPWFKPELEENANNEDFDPAFQQSQQGELNKLMSGTKQLTIKGIVRDDVETALIQIVDLNTGDSEIREAYVNDEIGNYIVVKINSESANLVANDGRKVELILFRIK